MRSRRVWVLVLLGALFLPPLTAVWLRQHHPAVLNSIERTLEIDAHRELIRVKAGAELAPFVSDGCSGGLSRAWEELASNFDLVRESLGKAPPWQSCCVLHDRSYHHAAYSAEAEDSFEARLQADEALRVCIRNSEPGPEGQAIADAMFFAVRVGGGPCSGLPWRWGYGWPECSPFGVGPSEQFAPVLGPMPAMPIDVPEDTPGTVPGAQTTERPEPLPAHDDSAQPEREARPPGAESSAQDSQAQP